MRYVIKSIATLLIILTCFSLRAGDDFCGSVNTAFKPGEVVTMKVYYTTMGMYIAAGEASFSVSLEKFNGRPAYHCVGIGKTYSFFDNFFKVRDRYESYIDTATCCLLNLSATFMKGAIKNIIM